MSKYSAIQLDNQLCFPLYACAKAVISKSTSFLKDLNLSYTQYLVMMVLWEQKNTTLKDLGKLLYLDSGTLTPVLKTLEQKGFITRKRSKNDDRVLELGLTKMGSSLKDKALKVPEGMTQCLNLSPEEMQTLYDLLYKVIRQLDQEFDD